MIGFTGTNVFRRKTPLLFHSDDLLALGMAADYVRRKKHMDNTVSYIIDRNINLHQHLQCGVFVLRVLPFPSRIGFVPAGFDVLDKKIEETLALGGTGILLAGRIAS